MARGRRTAFFRGRPRDYQTNWLTLSSDQHLWILSNKRIYDCNTGVFSSRDPMGAASDQNLYRAFHNMPSMRIDVMGLDDDPCKSEKPPTPAPCHEPEDDTVGVFRDALINQIAKQREAEEANNYHDEVSKRLTNRDRTFERIRQGKACGVCHEAWEDYPGWSKSLADAQRADLELFADRLNKILLASSAYQIVRVGGKYVLVKLLGEAEKIGEAFALRIAAAGGGSAVITVESANAIASEFGLTVADVIRIRAAGLLLAESLAGIALQQSGGLKPTLIGKAGECKRGINPGAKRLVPSALNPGRFRIPDELTELLLREIKAGVSPQWVTKQLRDYLLIAQRENVKFVIEIEKKRITQALIDWARDNSITIIEF